MWINLEMWQTIFGLDIQALSSASRIICKNLTFDNPGIFESTRILSQAHRDEVECCNLWLLHQYMYILCDSKYSSFNDDNLDLQRHILAAANLKQPWFFTSLIQKYVCVARQLSRPELELPAAITVFRGTADALKRIDDNAKYPDIMLSHQVDVIRVLKFSVSMLEHFIFDLVVAEEHDLVAEIVNLNLEIYQQCPFVVKLESLKFFYRFYKCQSQLRHSTLAMFTQVLQMSGAVLRHIATRPNDEECQAFDKTLMKLFEVMKVLPIDKGNTIPNSFWAVALDFLRHSNGNRFEHFPASFPAVVKNILENGFDLYGNRIANESVLCNHLNSMSGQLRICGLYLRLVCKTDRELKKCRVWNELVDRVTTNVTPETMLEFLEMVIQLEDTIPSLTVFPVGDYETIATTVFSRLTEQLQTKSHDTATADCGLSNELLLMQRMLLIGDSSTLDDRTQQQLFDALVFGLEDILELKFRPSAGVYQDFYENQKGRKTRATEELILSLVSTLCKDRLCRPAQNKLRLLMESIMKKSTVSLPASLVDIFIQSTLPSLLKNKHIPFDEKLIQFLQNIYPKSQYQNSLSRILKSLVCLSTGQDPSSCGICKRGIGDDDGDLIDVNSSVQSRAVETVVVEMFKRFLVHPDIEHKLRALDALPAINKHFSSCFKDCDLLDFVLANAVQPNPELLLEFSLKVPEIVPALKRRDKSINTAITSLLKVTKDSLSSTVRSRDLQVAVLRVLREFGLHADFAVGTFIRIFKLNLIFLLRDESKVVSEAMLVCEELCMRRKFKPRNIFNWYKQSILELIVPLLVSLFLEKGITIRHSLVHVAKLFGYFDPNTFIYENHPLLLAHLLPFVVKYSCCEQILNHICDVLQKDISSILANSFLVIYQCLFLNEPDEIHQKCGQLITETTGRSVYELLHLSDKTVAMFLIYYHRNPQCVTNTFKCLLAKDKGSECSLTQIVEYVSSKFLGVLTLFENHLVAQDNEKSIKRDVLLSLGEIIRLVGSKYITQFRFKIVSLLRTAVSVKEVDLHGVCAQVWDIFLRTVDVPCLGSLLSTIVVSMEPLLQHHAKEVNSILRYLIISNGNLLSSHLKDLFFVESLAIVDDVKQFLVQHNTIHGCTSRDSSSSVDSFDRLFFNYSTQINHDNMAVRIYGIEYLTALFRRHRSDINRLIMGQPVVDDQMEATLNQLINSCKHVEQNLQVAAGICVGEIGAIEPSYLRQNYAPQKKFCPSILSADFAISTLADLCHAYQFQKDSKFVDSFSLAIQELLQYHDVDPKRNQQMNIWMAIPERMQQIMEPLLTSCYMNICVKNSFDRHPVFPCRTCSEWAYTWASNIVQHLESEDIKRLLNSFKPSLKNDGQIMATLMPYVILHGLQYSPPERRTKIREEFQVVFKATAMSSKDRPLKSGDEGDDVATCQPMLCKEIPTLGFVPDEWWLDEAGCASKGGGGPLKESREDTSQNMADTEDVKEKCAKLAFNLLDFLGNWCNEYKQKHYRELSASEYKVVFSFLQSFDKRQLAQANFNCGEYARALQLMEEVVMQTRDSVALQEELSFFGQIYAELLDSDSLEGAMALKTDNLSLAEQILLNNVTGKLHESVTCYERMIQGQESVDVYDMKDMVHCYLGLDQPETALLICEGLMKKLYERHASDVPHEIAAEPLWRLGRFEEVERTVQTFQLQESSNWGVRCGLVLHALRENSPGKFAEATRRAREVILRSLRMTEIGENSYTKGYDQVLKLHLVAEIEKTFNVFVEMANTGYELAPKQLDAYFVEMSERMEVFKNQRNIQSILCLRRILYEELSGLLQRSCPYKDTLLRLQTVIKQEMGRAWIQSTKVARKAGATQQASLYILNCEEYGMRDLFLEKAKLQWSKGEQASTLQTLNRGMEHLLHDAGAATFQELAPEERLIFGQAKFLVATYNAQSMNVQTDLNLQHFKDSLAANKQSEICHVRYAQFLDKIYESTAITRKAERFELLRDVMTSYGNSMQYGFQYIYQSMPRMLSIWLDYTADKYSDAKMSAVLTKIADGFSEQLPAFMFFTAFSQLVSRICHPSQDVYNVLKTILVKLILCFPQQSLWMLLCVLKSSYASRTKKCAMVIDDRRLQGMKKLISDFNTLAVRLIDLAKVEIKKGVSSTTVSALVRDLPRIISDHNFSSIIVPCEQFMRPILPSPLDRNRPADKYVPFPQSMAYIQGVDEDVLVLQSLQKPRRVSFKASDGLAYKLLLKPKDDLRRDFRLMEFNNVVKHYLNLDLQARERRLNIRTYGVLPLNEEYGIIEWLDNLQTFRQILNTLYRQNKSGMQPAELNPYFSEPPLPLHKARERFVNVFLKRHPPVFDQWFKRNFTTPHNWYMARTAYVRTCGVMSIVGYVLGLGDRHCENILLDVTNGENVHVDFNCLFNAGERFGVPERVPFRLTQNMVHAMGPLGVEGPFRKTCEVTLRVMRAQQQTLMSVIRPFIYDPLLTWKKTAQTDGTERTDSDAMNNVQNIEDRLKGYVKVEKKTSSIPLSTEGQVNFVIKEATDINNLAPMYPGWSPFM